MGVILVLLGLVGAQVLFRNASEQTLVYASYSFPLQVAFPFVLLHLSVEPTSLSCLLVAGKERPPRAYQDSHGELQASYEAADLTSFALGRSEALVQLNSTGMQKEATVYLGVLLPERPVQGAHVLLEAVGHSKSHTDGELCPLDCSQHGTCAAGVCQCEMPWADQGCNLKVAYLELGQNYDLIVPPSTYRFFSTRYSQQSTLQLSLSRLQSDVRLFVSFGYSNQAPTLLNQNAAQQLDNASPSLQLYFDPSAMGPFGLLLSVRASDSSTQAVVSLHFEQAGASASSNLYVILGVLLGAGALFLSCCLVCLRCVCRRRRTRRQGARVQVYQSWSQSVEQEKILFEPSVVEFDPGAPQDCTICLDVLGLSKPVTELPCKHIFHTACINAWFEKQNFCCVCKHVYEVVRS